MRETDPSPDIGSQIGLDWAEKSLGDWRHPEEVPDPTSGYQKGLPEVRDA